MAIQIFFTLQTAIIYLLGVYWPLQRDMMTSANGNTCAGVFGNNIGLNATTAMQVPGSQAQKLVTGSKLAFMNWIWYLCCIWCLKGVLLCLYNKLTYVDVATLVDIC